MSCKRQNICVTRVYKKLSSKNTKNSWKFSRNSVCKIFKSDSCKKFHKYFINFLSFFASVNICFEMPHTYLLIQPGSDPDTRSYSDFESLNECLDGVCKIYEEHLKAMNPKSPTITYSIDQLFAFIDQLPDLSCLIYQQATNTYLPYNKEWIKERILVVLKQTTQG